MCGLKFSVGPISSKDFELTTYQYPFNLFVRFSIEHMLISKTSVRFSPLSTADNVRLNIIQTTSRLHRRLCLSPKGANPIKKQCSKNKNVRPITTK